MKDVTYRYFHLDGARSVYRLGDNDNHLMCRGPNEHIWLWTQWTYSTFLKEFGPEVMEINEDDAFLRLV